MEASDFGIFSGKSAPVLLGDVLFPRKCEANGRPDKERIFVWHVLPFNKEAAGSKEGEHLQLLQNDKSARVILYCKYSWCWRLMSSPWNSRTYSSGVALGCLSSSHSFKSQYSSYCDGLSRMGILKWCSYRGRSDRGWNDRDRLGH